MLDTMPVEQRQKIVSTMISKGMSTVAIANRIGVPVATVRTDRLVLSAPNPEEVRKCSPEKFGVQKPITGLSSMHPDDRRESVAKLHLKGESDAEIARTLNVSPSTVSRDRVHQNLSFPPLEIAISARRAKVKELIDAGLNCKEIMKALGLTKVMVLRDRAALGYVPWNEEESQNIKERRANVRKMIESGMSCRKVGMKLGITGMTVSRDCDAMGIVPPMSEAGVVSKKSQRRRAVLSEREKGTEIKDIAAKLGVSHMTVRRDIERLDSKKTSTM
jgi:DNA-binding NarL/FixJ family response regulator